MVVQFTKIGDFDFFHIDNCMADNKLAATNADGSTNDDYANVQMIENGCLVAKCGVINLFMNFIFKFEAFLGKPGSKNILFVTISFISEYWNRPKISLPVKFKPEVM